LNLEQSTMNKTGLDVTPTKCSHDIFEKNNKIRIGL